MRFKKHTLRSGGSYSSGRIACTKLLGIDSSVSSSDVSISRADGKSVFDSKAAPGAINFIRTGLGEISKRTGFGRVRRLSDINNIGAVINIAMPGVENVFFICGARLIREDEGVVFNLPAVPKRGNAYNSDKYIVVIGGDFVCACDIVNNKTEYFLATGYSNSDTNGIFYLPTVFIGGKPSGAAAPLENVNILNDFVCETFSGDGTSKEFKVHFDSDGFYKGQILSSDGVWYDSNEVAVQNGVLMFKNAPPAPSVTGEDNVKIIYKRKRSEKSAELLLGICSSTVNTRFGFGGSGDRIFVAGGERNKGRIFYSEADNPFYFPESNYIVVGDTNTLVYGLAAIDDTLYAICNDGIYTIKGYASSGDASYYESAVFGITGYIKSPRPVDVPPVIFDNEVVYLTREGVCAITPTGVLDERCSQIRSAFINSFLLKEDLPSCRLINYGDFLVISNSKDTVYLLDGKQFTTSDELPFSLRQYEAYIWKIDNIKFMWCAYGKTLFYSDGINVFEQKSGESGLDYSDEFVNSDGSVGRKNIVAYWETPYIYCSDFSADNFFMRVGVLLAGKTDKNGYAINTDLKVYGKFDNDDWRVLKHYDGNRSIFRYSLVDYGRLAYGNKPKSYSAYNRLLHKKGKSIKLRFENSNRGEPVTMQGFDLEYLQM